jgi:uncharacterized Fe-S center protein
MRNSKMMRVSPEFEDVSKAIAINIRKEFSEIGINKKISTTQATAIIAKKIRKGGIDGFI